MREETNTTETFDFYGVSDAIRRLLECKNVPCPGRPTYGASAVRVTFPEGTRILRRPAGNAPCSIWRWELPDGSTVSCDYSHKIGRFCAELEPAEAGWISEFPELAEM